MPQWAGSCWYELRYLRPDQRERFVDPEVERYWMGPQTDVRPDHPGGVDLYVGGVEHAVLHLLYARFWHKVLFDLGHVSSNEPYARLFNQGYILAAAYTGRPRHLRRGRRRRRRAVTARSRYDGEPVTREWGKMGKSLKNAVSPDEIYERLRRRHAAPVRDGDRPARRLAAVGDPRRRRHVPLPAAAVAQRRRRGDRRGVGGRRAGRRRHARGCCTARSTACAPRWRRCASTPRSPS